MSSFAYINNPNGISDGLNYVEDGDDVELMLVFKMILMRCSKASITR